MPVMQTDMLGHSGSSTSAQATITNRAVRCNINITKTLIIINMNILCKVEGEEIPPPKPDFSAPPPYEVATKLPSYEEVQREKSLQGEPHPQIHMVPNCNKQSYGIRISIFSIN